MNKIIALLGALIALLIVIFFAIEGAVAVIVGLLCFIASFFIIEALGEEKKFFHEIFARAFLLRVAVGAVLLKSGAWQYFAGDAETHHYFGYQLTKWLWGVEGAVYLRNFNMQGPGWGMIYFVGGLYSVTGENQLAGQILTSAVGAATAIVTYLCAKKVFNNTRIARMAALMVAFFPSLVLWSSMLLKDGLIIFLLVLIMYLVVRVQEEFNIGLIALLIGALTCVLSLRFYIFFMVTFAIFGNLIFGLDTKSSGQALIRKFVAVIVIGVGLVFVGALQTAQNDYDKYMDLAVLQSSRNDLSRAESGFEKDADITTVNGILIALPTGFLYLMLAPFPWQITSVRSAITMPEMILWWFSIPFLLSGLWFSVKYKLRPTIGILLFTILLTLSYSLFQGNVGTAYRQRTQIQVFHFMFIAVGWTLFQEKRENKKLLRLMQNS